MWLEFRDGQVGEPWPPDDRGLLDGYGLDTSTPTPYRELDANTSGLKDDPGDDPDRGESKVYDLMSYCAVDQRAERLDLGA